ncbi:Flagellar motor switch protein FliM [compost metagenome]
MLPIDLPDIVSAQVDGVPVMHCEYGSQSGLRALRVTQLVDHTPSSAKASADLFAKGALPDAKESNHD